MSIQIKNLSKTYSIYYRESFFKSNLIEKPSLTNINLEIKKGEQIALIGPNGSGKSTLIKLLSGTLQPSSGSVSIFGLDAFRDRELLQKKIAIFWGGSQQSQWPALPAYETLMHSKYLYDIPKKEFEKNLETLSTLFELKEFYEQPMRQLSLGQRTRVDLCSRLLHDPEIIILDEPTLGLDAYSKIQFRIFLTNWTRGNSKTLILTTHDANDIESCCERALILNKGSIEYDLPIKKLSDILNYKIINISTSKKVFWPEKYNGFIYKKNDYSTQFKIPLTNNNLKEIVSSVLEKPELIDFEITKPNIEQIISEIYNAKISLSI
jgi:ABC-2 type transport system ATP-binding protein